MVSVTEFSARVKQKYPEYKDVDDFELAKRIVEKYPEYASKVDLTKGVKKKDEIPVITLEKGQELPAATQKPAGLPSEAPGVLPAASSPSVSPSPLPSVPRPKFKLPEGEDLDLNDPLGSLYFRANPIEQPKLPSDISTYGAVGPLPLPEKADEKTGLKQKDYEDVKAVFETDPTYALAHLSKATGKTEQEILATPFAQLSTFARPMNKTDEVSLQTVKRLKSANRLSDPNNWLGGKWSPERAAVAYASETDPAKAEFIRQYMQPVKIQKPDGTVEETTIYGDPKEIFKGADAAIGSLVYNYLSDPINEAAAMNSPFASQFVKAKEDFYKNYPKFAATIVADKVSKAYEASNQRGFLSRVAQMPTETLFAELDEVAKQTLTPEEYEQVYLPQIKGNEYQWIDVPSVLEQVAAGGKSVFKGIKSTFTEPFTPTSKTQLEAWEDQASNVSADVKGFWKFTNDAAHMAGFVMGMSAAGAGLKAGQGFSQGLLATGRGMTPTAMNMANAGLVFFGDNLKAGKLKYPNDPAKAIASAGINTALFMALAKDLFPVKQVESALKTITPQVDVVVNQLTKGAITREAAKAQVRNIFTKSLETLSAATKQNVKVSSEMAAIAALDRGLDNLMGLDKERYDQFHGRNAEIDAFTHMFMGNVGVAAWAGYGKMRYKNRAAIESYYDVATRPDFYKKVISEGEGTPEAKQEVLDNISFVESLKKELDAKGMSPSKQKAYIADAIGVRALRSQKSSDPTLQADNERKANEMEAEQKELLNDPAEEVKLTDEGWQVVTFPEEKAEAEVPAGVAESAPPVQAAEAKIKVYDLEGKKYEFDEGTGFITEVATGDVYRPSSELGKKVLSEGKLEGAPEVPKPEVPSTEGVMPVVVPEDVSMEVARSREAAAEVPQPTKESVSKEIADLRAKEQAEYDAMPDPKNEAKRKEIYDRYDKLITPLLEKEKELSEEELPFGEVKPRESVPEKEEKNIRQRALNIEASDPRSIVLQYFINGGSINPKSIKELFGGKKGAEKVRWKDKAGLGEQRASMKMQDKNGPTLDGLAHMLWENSRIKDIADTQDFRNAIEEVLSSHAGTKSMAKEMVESYDADYMSMLNDQERARIAEEAHKEFQKISLLVPQPIREDVVKLLDKYRNADGFVDWKELESATNGFDPDFLDLSLESTKFINDAIEQVKQTGRFSGIPGQAVPTEARAGDPLRNFADKVREGKISKLGGFRTGTGFDAVWDASLEVVAKAIEGGATVADAIEAGLKYVKSTGWYKKLTDPKDFDNKYRDHLNNEYDAISKQETGEVPVRPEARAGGKVEGEVPGARPIEAPREEVKTGEVEGEEKVKPKTLLNRIVESSKVSKELKEKIREKGLTYLPANQKEATKLANSVIDSMGLDQAIEAASKNEFSNVFGGMNTAVLTEAAARLYKDPVRQAQVFSIIDVALRAKGQEIAYMNEFYTKNPEGVIIYENKLRQDRFNEWAQKKESSWRDFFKNVEDIMKDPEIANLINEQVSEKLKAERSKERVTKRDKVHKAIDSGIAKVKDFIKKNLTADLPGGTQKMGASIDTDKVLNAAGEIIKKAYDAGESIKDAVERAVEYISAQFGDKDWGVDEFRKAALAALSESDGAAQKIADRYLSRMRKRLEGLSAKEKDQVIRKSFSKIVESGGLDYQEFRDIIGEVTGRGSLTEAQAERMKELVAKTNQVEEAAKRAQEERTPESIKAYRIAELEAAKASAELHEMLDTNPNISDRITSIMQLNTLGIPALINNPIYNLWNQATLRVWVGLVNTAIDRAQSQVAKAVGKNYVPETDILNSQVQAEFFKKLGFGAKEALTQLFTGLNRQDYIQKELTTQKIRPLESLKSLRRALTGKEKLTKKQTIDKLLQATAGLPAEVVARTLNLGDKPMRFAAEGATAAMFAKTLGLKDIDYTLFIEFPREEAYRVLKNQGLSEAEANEKADYIKESIIREGKRSTFQQDNILNNILNSIFELEQFKGHGNLIKSFAISPYIKIPANAYWSYYNMVNPEVAFLQSLIYGARAAKTEGVKSKLAIREAKYWFGHAVVGIATRAVIIGLVNQGVFNPGSDREETKKEREGKSTFIRQGTIDLDKLAVALRGGDVSKVQGGVLVPLKYLGHWGTIGNTIAKQHEEMTPEQREAKQRFWGAAFGGLELEALGELQEGIFSNTSALLSALQDDRSLKKYGLNVLNLLTNIVQPAAAAQVERSLLDYQSTAKADSFMEEIKNSMLQRMWALRKILGQQPPAKIGIWGDQLDRKENFMMRWFGISKENKDNFAYPIWQLLKKTDDIGYLPPTVLPRLNDVDLTVEQTNRLQELVGKARKSRVAPYINNQAEIEGFNDASGNPVKFKDLNDEDKKFVLNYLYTLGREDGVNQFYLAYPELNPYDEFKTETDYEKQARRNFFRMANRYKGKTDKEIELMLERQFKK